MLTEAVSLMVMIWSLVAFPRWLGPIQPVSQGFNISLTEVHFLELEKYLLRLLCIL
jgi:hypothetical protein